MKRLMMLIFLAISVASCQKEEIKPVQNQVEDKYIPHPDYKLVRLEMNTSQGPSQYFRIQVITYSDSTTTLDVYERNWNENFVHQISRRDDVKITILCMNRPNFVGQTYFLRVDSYLDEVFYQYGEFEKRYQHPNLGVEFMFYGDE